jgi:hypothetical protein
MKGTTYELENAGGGGGGGGGGAAAAAEKRTAAPTKKIASFKKKVKEALPAAATEEEEAAADGDDDGWVPMVAKYNVDALTESILDIEGQEVRSSVGHKAAATGMVAAVQTNNIGVMLLWLVFDYDVDGRDVASKSDDAAFASRYVASLPPPPLHCQDCLHHDAPLH